MPVLTFKNKQLNSFIAARDLSSITNQLIYGERGIPTEDISALNGEPSFFYSSNELILSLDGVTPALPQLTEEQAAFERLRESLAGLAEPRMDRVPPARITFSTPAKIRVNSFWNIAPTSDPTASENYRMFDSEVEIVSSTSDRIVFKLAANERVEIVENFKSLSAPKPQYGILLIVIEFQNDSGKFESAYAVKYTHAPLFSSPVPSDGILNTRISDIFNTYISPAYTGETLFVPTLSSSFVYNFYEQEESDYEIYKSRNYKGQKLTDIPKYIRLTWNKPNFSPEIFTEENKPLPLPASIDPKRIDEIAKPFDDLLRRTARDVLRGVGASTSTPASPPPPTLPPPTPPAPTRNLFGATSAGALKVMGTMISLPSPKSELANSFVYSPRVREASSAIYDGIGPTRTDGTIVTPRGDGATPISPGAAASSAVDLDTTTIADPSLLPSPTEYTDLIARDSDYIGYVIEKYRASEDGSDFVLIDIIAIPNKNTLEYIDTKIAYGELYRYKVRSVFRFVNNFNLNVYSDSDSLLSKKQSVDYVDTNYAIMTRKTFYFDSENSDGVEITIEDLKRPDSPSSVRLFANSFDKKIFITWSQKSQNRDVLGFNIYRRTHSSKFIKLNNELLQLRNNFYVDYDLEPDVEYIYAIESVDVHGNFSKLSAQFISKIKQIINFDNFSCEFLQKFYAEEGYELNEPLKPKQDSLILIKSKLSININPLFKNTDENNTYLIKVTSLDTGIQKEFKINFKTQTIYHVAPYIPDTPRFWIGEALDTESEREALKNLRRITSGDLF